MQAVTLEHPRIHCDACHHEFPGAPSEWHNRSCPRCGEADIITDQDMEVWSLVNELAGAINALAGEAPAGYAEGRIAFTFGTAGRHKKDPS